MKIPVMVKEFGSVGRGQPSAPIGGQTGRRITVIIEPLRAPAEPAALQLLDDELEALDLGLRLAEAGALGCERAHQLL